MQKQYEKMFGKEYWRGVIVDKSTDHDKTNINLLYTTIPTKEFFFPERELKKALRDTLTGAGMDTYRQRPSNFWLVRSEHAYASYPGLSFRPPGFSFYMGREEKRFDWTSQHQNELNLPQRNLCTRRTFADVF